MKKSNAKNSDSQTKNQNSTSTHVTNQVVQNLHTNQPITRMECFLDQSTPVYSPWPINLVSPLPGSTPCPNSTLVQHMSIIPQTPSEQNALFSNLTPRTQIVSPNHLSTPHFIPQNTRFLPSIRPNLPISPLLRPKQVFLFVFLFVFVFLKL